MWNAGCLSTVLRTRLISAKVGPMRDTIPEDREDVFISTYLQTWSLKKAARAAGYTGDQPSIQGRKVLERPAVRTRVDAFLESEAMSAQEVLARLAMIARSDVFDFIGP